MLLRALSLVTFSCSLNRSSLEPFSEDSLISTPFPILPSALLPLMYVFLSLLCMHFAFISWDITVSQDTFLLVGHSAARTTFTPCDIMIPVPDDELVLSWSALGRFSGGCLWYAKESIRSQHFVLKIEVFNWIMYLEMSF